MYIFSLNAVWKQRKKKNITEIAAVTAMMELNGYSAFSDRRNNTNCNNNNINNNKIQHTKNKNFIKYMKRKKFSWCIGKLYIYTANNKWQHAINKWTTKFIGYDAINSSALVAFIKLYICIECVFDLLWALIQFLCLFISYLMCVFF